MIKTTHIKKSSVLLLMSSILCFTITSCLNGVLLIPITVARFQFEVVKDSDGKHVKFINLSENAQNCQWYFENAEPATSSEFNPGEVVFKNSGTFQVRLKVSNKNGTSSEISKAVTIN